MKSGQIWNLGTTTSMSGWWQGAFFILLVADVEKLSHRRNILYFDLCPQSGVLRGLYKNIDCSSCELATMIWQLEILHFATMSWPPYAKSQQTAWCPAGLDCGARLQLTRASPGPGRRHLFGKRPDLTLLCSTSHSTSARNNKLQSLLVSWFTIDVLVFVFIFVFVFVLYLHATSIRRDHLSWSNIDVALISCAPPKHLQKRILYFSIDLELLGFWADFRVYAVHDVQLTHLQSKHKCIKAFVFFAFICIIVQNQRLLIDPLHCTARKCG